MKKRRRFFLVTIGIMIMTLAGTSVPSSATEGAAVSFAETAAVEPKAQEEAAQSTVIVDTDSTIVQDYLGVGFQWDPSDSYDYTEEQWQMIFDRVSYTKAPIVRLMLRANAYTTGWDKQGKPVYDWNSPEMKRVYRILDYCEKHHIQVMIGEWSTSGELGISASDDKVWAELIGDFLDHLLKEKKYTSLKYYNYINEPNGYWATEDGDRFATWRRGMLNVDRVLRERKLSDRIQLVGPDSSGQDEWVDQAVYALGDRLGAYEVHRYATDQDVLSGELERMVSSKRDFINKNDPNGPSKLFYMAEAGIVTGKDEAHDQQNRVKTFEYGVLMADYTIQSIRGGQAGLISWMLDDSMHNAPGYPAGSREFKTWGFWNTLGDRQDQALRPWYYPMSLFSRYFPKGSRTVYASDAKSANVRVTAAVLPHGDKKKDITIALVNDSDMPKSVKLVVPNAKEAVTINRFIYSQENRPTDSNGFPVPADQLAEVRLAEGLDVSMPGRSVVFLTTMDTDTGAVKMEDGGNVALGQTVSVSSNQYLTEHTGDEAVDGKLESTWISKRTSPQWLTVDLEKPQTLNRVKLAWDSGFAKAYQIQVSADGTNWTDAYSDPLGSGGALEDIVFAPQTARFVRVMLTQMGTTLGYSIRELSVYHVPNAPLTQAPQLPASIHDTLDDWSKTFSHSGDLVLDSSNVKFFNNDSSRVKRYTADNKEIVYRAANVTDFMAKIYYCETEHQIKFYVSANGADWTEAAAKNSTPSATSDGWYVTEYTPDGPIPPDAQFLKIVFVGGDPNQPWSPQLGEIAVNTEASAP